jgi:hypothetical protein
MIFETFFLPDGRDSGSPTVENTPLDITVYMYPIQIGLNVFLGDTCRYRPIEYTAETRSRFTIQCTAIDWVAEQH